MAQDHPAPFLGTARVIDVANAEDLEGFCPPHQEHVGERPPPHAAAHSDGNIPGLLSGICRAHLKQPTTREVWMITSIEVLVVERFYKQKIVWQ